MECQPAVESGCENCVLCTVSKRAHFLKNSGQAFLQRVQQKGKTGVTYVVQGISERSRRFEEALPQTSEILGITKRKILSVGVVVLENSKKVYHKGVSGAKNAYTFMKNPSIPSAQRVKRFFRENIISCYFCGGLMLTGGTFLYAIPVGFTGSSALMLSIWFIFVGGVLVWVPVIYWWRSSSPQNRLVETVSQAQLIERPPPYESLVPVRLLDDEAPPAYEDILPGNQDLLSDSNCGFVAVPLCAVHQPIESLTTQDAPNVINVNVAPSHSIQEPNCVPCVAIPVQYSKISQRNFTTLQRSRSMTDLYYVRF